MNPSSTPTPRRPGKAGASLRTQRPTTYYDTESNPALPGGHPLPSGSRPTARRADPDRLPASGKNAKRGQASNLPIGGPRPTEKSKIGAALLNKRQSISYGHARAKTTPQPTPAVPVIPGRFGGDINDGGLRKQNPAIPMVIDTETLSQNNFDPERFVTIHLATSGGGASDPETLKLFKDLLRDTSLRTNQSLQENAFANYGAFVAVSKEISTLESEMLELKSVLEEFKTLPNDLDTGLGMFSESNFSGETKRKAARNSIADVNALYKNQLEALWEKVEGSQKFLPIQPGRHIIAESTTFVELNPITYQPKQAVHLFLLDDSLLIAIQKQTRMASGSAKLMAEKCFSLAQISIIDLDDGSDLHNAIQIQRNQEKVILRTDRYRDKKELLNTFRKVSEDMARRKRKQSIMDLDSRGPNSMAFLANATPPGSLEASFQRMSIGSHFHSSKFHSSGKDDPAHKFYGQIGDLLDEVSVATACRNYGQAIDLLEESKSILSRVSPEQEGRKAHLVQAHQGGDPCLVLRNRIDERTQEVVNKLLEDLLEPTVRKTQLVRIAQLITRLGGGLSTAGPTIERAKDSFLAMRSELVRQQTRHIKFEGDLLLWVSQSSFVLFTLIKNTCEWYMTAFKDNRMASGFVSWATEQIEHYGPIFRRQVYEGKEDEGVIKDCLSVTKAHAGMLKEVGLDFLFLLENVLQKSGDPIRKRRPVGAPSAAEHPQRRSLFNPEIASQADRPGSVAVQV